jgi:hypothetical protein
MLTTQVQPPSTRVLCMAPVYEGGREGGRKGGRKGGREGRREGEREGMIYVPCER